MDKQYIISIDLGTSSCKTALFNGKGVMVSIASREHKTFFGENGAVEQDPNEWWLGTRETIREVLWKAGVTGSQIAVVGIDSQSSAMIPVGRNGEVLHHAMIWTDRRAVMEKKWIDVNVGQEILTQINGNRNDESNVAPKLMWFKNNYPKHYQQTYKILNAAGFLAYKLTGIFSCNLSEGGLTQLFDVETGEWSGELVKACELDMDKLPALYQCFDIVGNITAQAGDNTGLLMGTPVVAGAMDAVACGLGCGITKDGDAFITGGTVTALGVCTGKPVRSGSLHVYHHIVPGTWCNMAGVDFGGGNYRWFRDKFMQECNSETVYEEMNQMAEQVNAGADKLLFLPTLVGQRCPQWDGSMRGVFFGISPNHGREHFLRAIMEGNALAVREIMELLGEEGAVAKKLRIAGGIAKSNIWMEIFAEVLARPLYLAECEEATAMGNMMNAAYGAGILDSFQAGDKFLKFEPVAVKEANYEKYDRLYGLYQKLYPAIKAQFEELSEMQL